MKPTAALSARLRFSTKDVGKGFYRGNRTGSMGAHTPYGGFIIDYRKVRNYNVPDLKNFKLTPYVTEEIDDAEAHEESYSWEDDHSQSPDTASSTQDSVVARRTRALAFLKEWRQSSPQEFEDWVETQEDHVKGLVRRERQGETIEAFQRYRAAQQLEK